MNSNEEIKEMVKQKYAEIALQNQDTKILTLHLVVEAVVAVQKCTIL